MYHMFMSAGEPFDALQKYANKLSATQLAGATTLSSTDEDAFLNSQVELSIALDARELTAAKKQQQKQQQQQQALVSSNPRVAAAGSAGTACQSSFPATNMLRTPEPHFSYFAPQLGQRFGEPMAQPNAGPRFPNAVSVEPHAPNSNSAQYTPFHAWSHAPGQVCRNGAASHSVPPRHLDALSSSDDDDALFDACDAALARYAAAQKQRQDHTAPAPDGNCSGALNTPQRLRIRTHNCIDEDFHQQALAGMHPHGTEWHRKQHACCVDALDVAARTSLPYQ